MSSQDDPFSKDLLDMLAAFVEEGVEFLLIGGHALGVHGYYRATDDLDLWVRPSPSNASKVWHALTLYGAPLAEHRVVQEDFAVPNNVYQIGLPPNRIDILTSIAGVEFDSAWSNREVRKVAGLEVPVIGREDLIKNKISSGRPQDVLDVKKLKAGCHTPQAPPPSR